MRYLAIDVGSSVLKSLVVDDAGTNSLPRKVPMPNATRGLRKGRHESDASAIRGLVLAHIHEALDACPDIAGVGFSTQMHGILLSDDDNSPLTPFLSWQDERVLERDSTGEPFSAALADRIPSEHQVSSGVPLRPGIGAGALAHWLAENPLDSHHGVRVHTLGSFLIASLSGEHVTHITNAAPLGLVDLRLGSWSPDLCASYGFENFTLPRVLHTFSRVGEFTYLGRTIAVHPDVGDHQASILGGGGLGADEVAISLGTAGIIARQVDGLELNVQYENRPYFDGSYLQTISRQPGGRLAETFIRLVASVGREIFDCDIGEQELWHDVYRMLGEGSVVDSPATVSVDESGMSIQGISDEKFGARELFTALFASYGVAYSAALDRLFEGAPRPIRAHVNGGMVSNNEWLRNHLADSLNLDIPTPPEQNMALLGLSILLRGVDSATPRDLMPIPHLPDHPTEAKEL